MKSLTHEQVQQMLHSGLPQSEALLAHLAACSQCRSYAALVTELSTTLPAIYSPAVFSPQEIRQKAADGNGQLLRRTRSALTLQNLRSGVLVGGVVVVLLFLTILAPKLLPVQPAGAPDLTPTQKPLTTTLPSSTPAATTALEDVPGTERLDSPDGQYTAIFHPQNISLEIVDAQGNVAVNYLPDPAAAGQIILGTWSPDSERLTFWQGSNSASLQADGLPLWVLDVQTGAAKELSKAAVINKTYQSWSPDGEFLAFTDGGGRSAQINKWLALYQVQDDKLEIVIPADQLVTGALAWSPWNSQIAVAAVDASQTGPDYADNMGWNNPAIAARRIYLVEPLARAYWRLTQTEAYEDAPKWLQDGGQIYFVQRDQDTARIMSANPILGEAQPTGCEAPMPPSAQYYGQVDWSELYETCVKLKALWLDDLPPVTQDGLFQLSIYPPLFMDYDPSIWLDKSDLVYRAELVNYLQNKELESCSISVQGASGFYPENMPEITLGVITYQVHESESAEIGRVIKTYFAKSSIKGDVTSTAGMAALAVQASLSEAEQCNEAAKIVLGTLHAYGQSSTIDYCDQVTQNHSPAADLTTYCDTDYSFAFDYPADWNIRLISSAPDATAAPLALRKALRFEKPDMSNYIRTDTYRLYASMTLEQRMRRFSGYNQREFQDKDYSSLMVGGKRAYALIMRWAQDYPAVYLFFEHADYFTVMELKAIDRASLDLNWEIARTIQIPGATSDTNVIPTEVIQDSYALLVRTPEAAATTSNNAFSVGFSSDGNILVFNSDVNGLMPEDQMGLMDPFIYNLQNGTFFQVIPTIGGNNRAATSARAISLSTDGRYLLYRLRSNSPQPAAEHYNDVMLRDLSTGKDSRIDFLPLEETLGTAIYPSLSPDGRYLALNVAENGWQLYLYERTTGKITPVSVDVGNRWIPGSNSTEPVFSADGRYLAFVSDASNLVEGDTRCSEANPACGDVFLFEIATARLERIPAKIQFTMGNPYPYLTISADAHYLAWTELIDPSPIYRPVIRLHDRSTGKTETVWGGMGAYQTGHSPSISDDGRWLAFGALAEYDYGEIPLPDSFPQVYLLDRQTNEAIVISKDANNNWGNGPSGVVALQQEGWSSDIHISGDGRYVAFSSQAANLLPAGVTKRQCFDPYVVGAYACYDLFVYDRETDELTWLSQGQPGK